MDRLGALRFKPQEHAELFGAAKVKSHALGSRNEGRPHEGNRTCAIPGKHFQWRAEGRVGVITLDRRKEESAHLRILRRLRDLFRGLSAARDIKAVVVTGAGGKFLLGRGCATRSSGRSRRCASQAAGVHAHDGCLVKAMRHCPQPVSAAVDGVCAGAGAMIALFSDLRYGTRSAQSSLSLQTRVGLAAATWRPAPCLPAWNRPGATAELLYTGSGDVRREGFAGVFFNGSQKPTRC